MDGRSFLMFLTFLAYLHLRYSHLSNCQQEFDIPVSFVLASGSRVLFLLEGSRGKVANTEVGEDRGLLEV